MSATPSSKVGNFAVYVATKNPSGNQLIVDETREFVCAVERILDAHKKTVSPQVAQYVLTTFAHALKGQKKWPKEL